MASLYDSIEKSVGKYVKVEDAEEEVCELYAVYYSSDTSDRLNLVDASKTELEIEIQYGQRHIPLTIRQNPNINGELGQTGAVLWSSSVVMSEFFASKKASGDWPIDGINALELGSGCGLVGLTLHRLGASRVVLTDQSRMMRLLSKNIDMNRLPSAKHRQRQDIFAAEYIWGDAPEDQRVLSEPVDLVVVSDCVYHESVVPLLVRSLVDVCRAGREDGAPVVAVIGQELRSDLVHQVFLAQLLQHFTVHRVPISDGIDGVYVLYVAWLHRVTSERV
ncbi:hypothetical protein LPJ56_005807 [Coemansia sp. RSA 2599]|nr:hypothetical protein LPJ56_005807 [Coemansia sp. RSA 2599]